MNEPFEVILNPDRMMVDAISQEIYHIESREKMPLLLAILKAHEQGNALIFTNTKQAAYAVSNRLEHNGFRAEYLIGDLPQNRRRGIVEDFKSGKLQYLVATDVAARGLHIDNLELVVNYDIPEDPENYVHRIGRTGRIGRAGRAITLACEKFVMGLESLETFIDMKIPVVWADEGFFEIDASEGMRFHLDNPKMDRPSERSQQKPRRDDKKMTVRKSPRKEPPLKVKEKGRVAKDEEQARMQPGISDADRLAFYSRKYGENFKVVNN